MEARTYLPQLLGKSLSWSQRFFLISLGFAKLQTRIAALSQLSHAVKNQEKRKFNKNLWSQGSKLKYGICRGARLRCGKVRISSSLFRCTLTVIV